MTLFYFTFTFFASFWIYIHVGLTLLPLPCHWLEYSTTVWIWIYSNISENALLLFYTGWGKIKCPDTKIAISQKCLNIFAPNFAHLFVTILRTNLLLCAVFTWHMSNWRKRKPQEWISQLNKKLILLLKYWATVKYHLCSDVIIFMFTCNIAL